MKIVSDSEYRIAYSLLEHPKMRRTRHNVEVRCAMLQLLALQPEMSLTDMQDEIGIDRTVMWRMARMLLDQGYLWEELYIDGTEYKSYRPNRYKLSEQGRIFVAEISQRGLPSENLNEYCKALAERDPSMRLYLERIQRWKDQGWTESHD